MAPVAQNGGNLTEWGKASPSGDDHQGHTSTSHSDIWDMSTTWDMQLDSTGEEGHRLEPVRSVDRLSLWLNIYFSSIYD